MEIQSEHQKNKLHRYFQSFHLLPKNNQTLTMEQLDKNMMAESNNLFSLFQLVVHLKYQHTPSDNPSHTFRRLMTLVYCIMEHYELYLSKIKTLIKFWWEAGVQNAQNIRSEKRINKQIDKQFSLFREKYARDQYFYHVFRCFNSILRKFSQNIQKKQNILHNNLQISLYLQTSLSNFRVAVFQNKYQSEHKILMTIQYCRFLISAFHFRKNNHNSKVLFNEFCQSINQIIRLMKKFYKCSIIQFRKHLKQIIENGHKVFSSSIPYHKNKLFKAILLYLNRSQQQYQSSLIEEPICSGEKKGLIILSRSLNNWKFIYQKKFRKNINQIHTLAKNNKKTEKIPEFPIITKTFKQKLEHIDKGIDYLKKKRSQSLRQKSQVDQNQFEIRIKVQRQIQKQFSRINYLKNRSYSTIALKKQDSKMMSSEKNKKIELKLEDYKRKRWQQENKRKEDRNLRLKLKIR